MFQKTEWEIPPQAQPRPDDFGFNLDEALRSVVTVRSSVPGDAFTAGTLGTDRAGSGVVIRTSGLILTVGYLITEAETIWLGTSDGRAIQGHALCHDPETGFGLIQALGKLDLPALKLGHSRDVKLGDPVILAAGGGRRHAIRATVMARQEFAGYWEYLIEDALFTVPAHPFWGGAPLIGGTGEVLGIGSLHIQQSTAENPKTNVNMVVPVDLLHPALDDLLTYGRRNHPPRPWLGVYTNEQDGRVIVTGLADNGPADAAGVRVGDVIRAIKDEPIPNLGTFYRKLWGCGQAGILFPLELVRDGKHLIVGVRSTDRGALLKAPRLH